MHEKARKQFDVVRADFRRLAKSLKSFKEMLYDLEDPDMPTLRDSIFRHRVLAEIALRVDALDSDILFVQIFSGRDERLAEGAKEHLQPLSDAYNKRLEEVRFRKQQEAAVTC